MYGVTEIRKINANKRADVAANEVASFAPLRNGEVLIRHGRSTETLTGGDATTFLSKVKGKADRQIAKVIDRVFAAKSGALPLLSLV